MFDFLWLIKDSWKKRRREGDKTGKNLQLNAKFDERKTRLLDFEVKNELNIFYYYFYRSLQNKK